VPRLPEQFFRGWRVSWCRFVCFSLESASPPLTVPATPSFLFHLCAHTHTYIHAHITLAYVCVHYTSIYRVNVARYAVARFQITQETEIRTEETDDGCTAMARRDNYDARVIRLSKTVEPMQPVAETVVLFKFPAILPCARPCRLQRLHLARQVRPSGRQQRRLGGSPPRRTCSVGADDHRRRPRSRYDTTRRFPAFLAQRRSR